MRCCGSRVGGWVGRYGWVGGWAEEKLEWMRENVGRWVGGWVGTYCVGAVDAGIREVSGHRGGEDQGPVEESNHTGGRGSDGTKDPDGAVEVLWIGWVVEKMEESEAVRMSYYVSLVGGWVVWVRYLLGGEAPGGQEGKEEVGCLEDASPVGHIQKHLGGILVIVSKSCGDLNVAGCERAREDGDEGPVHC